MDFEKVNPCKEVEACFSSAVYKYATQVSMVSSKSQIFSQVSLCAHGVHHYVF